MADRKITDLTALAAGSQATGDLLTIVDVSESAAADKNKKITVESLFKGIPGDVGVGVSAPAKQLHIHNSSATEAQIQLTDSGTGSTASDGMRVGWNGTLGQIYVYENADLRFATNDSERMRIDSSGRLLVGTTAASGSGVGKIVSRNDVDYSSTEFEDNATLCLQNETNSNPAVLLFHSNDSGGSSGRSAIVGGNVEGVNSQLGFYGNATNLTTSTDPDVLIDSSGRLLVGSTSAIFNNNDAKVQIQGSAGGTLVLGRNDSSVTAGNGIGLIRFYGNDGGSYQECARIAANADGTHANNDKPTRLSFFTTADNASSPTEQLRINSDGDLLFKQEAGSNYPEQQLKWSNDNTTANGFFISQDSDRNGKIFHQQGLDIIFGTNNTERMRIDNNGRLGIGTTSLVSKFTIDNGGRADPSSTGATTQSNAALEINADSESNTRLMAGMSTGSKFWMQVQNTVGNTADDILLNPIGGNVGIGTTSPSYELQVSQSGSASDIAATSNVSSGTASRFVLGNSAGTARATFNLTGGGSETAYLGTEGSFPLYFQTNGAERMRITSGSSNGATFLFNCTSNPSSTVKGSAIIPNGANGNYIQSAAATTSAYAHAQFLNTNGLVGSIQTSGSSTSYNTSSDYRLKENVVDLDSAITRVKQLAPKRFNFIADDTKTVDGFLAHEAQTVVPEAVTGSHNEVDDDGIPVYQSIDQSKLVPLLTAALQEAIAEIETLKTKVAALEAG